MKPFPTAAEQVAAEEARQAELAQERVARREKMGQQAQPEPALGETDPEPEPEPVKKTAPKKTTAKKTTAKKAT